MENGLKIKNQNNSSQSLTQKGAESTDPFFYFPLLSHNEEFQPNYATNPSQPVPPTILVMPLYYNYTK